MSGARRLRADLIQGLFVSCQALPGSPLRDPVFMTAMARAAVLGGAKGIRANGFDDVQAIRAAVNVPIIGIRKTENRGPDQVYITPTAETAAEVARAGADIIAIDGTSRPRPGGGTLAGLIQQIHQQCGLPVMADVDTLAAGMAAREAGADLVATTLSGYTTETTAFRGDDPDMDLAARLVTALDCPIVAEGRFTTVSHLQEALSLGVAAVVIGTAITNPTAITRSFTCALG